MAGAACCITTVHTLALFTACLRVVVVLFDRILPQLDAAGLNPEEMKSEVIRLLATQIVERGMPALAGLACTAVTSTIAASSVRLTDSANLAYVEQFFSSVIKVCEAC